MTAESKSPLALTGSGYGITISPSAEAEKRRILVEAAAVIGVRDNAQAGIAQGVIKMLASFRVAVEKSRKLVKEPVIEVGRLIDEKARTFSEDIQAEESRITRLVSDFAAEQERKRREEEARLRREAEEARRKAEDEERARLKAEREAREALERQRIAEEAAAKAKDGEARAKAEAERLRAEGEAAEAIRKQEEAEWSEIEARQRAEEQAVATPVVLAPKGTKPVLDFDVVDLHALYKAHPGLVVLSPSRAAILTELKRQQDAGEEPALPGVNVLTKFKVSTR